MCTTTNSPHLLQPHILISNFPSSCARLCIKTSRLVKNVRLPKVQNIQPCRARLLARSLSLFFGENSSLLSILFTVGRLLHSSIQNNFTLFFKVLFYSCFY